MTALTLEHKHNTKGGISQLAIFAIITLVGAAVSLITNIVSASLNAKANQEMNDSHGLFSLKAQPDIFVF